MAEESALSVKTESRNMKKGRAARRHPVLSKDDAFAIVQSAVHKAQSAGVSFSVINLPNNSLGIVAQNAWICTKCGTFQIGLNGLGNVCAPCLSL